MGIRINGRDINTMDIFDKIKNYLEKNSYAKEFEIIRKNVLMISFKIDRFDFWLIKGMFRYWGLDYTEYFKSFSAMPLSRKNVNVKVWLLKIPENVVNCNHKYVYRGDWDANICKKCGYFNNNWEEVIKSEKTK